MSRFYNILSSRNLPRHNGQSLWKYNLSDIEFYHLTKALTESKSLNNVDARDCALYYAEWWKRCYNGGLPSKRDVFNSIANQQWFDEDAFFKMAKKGANLLGVNWIKNQNTLYFRTLLLQGGLPIKHISRHKGAYKSFLLKILELNPSNIDDFAFDSRITSLLPSSSRNDEVYECCLEIVKAIINEDSEYLTILDNDHELNEISNELRIKKQSLNFGRRKTKFRVTWVFEPAKEQIRLYFGIPEMDSDNFRSLFLDDDSNSDLDFEYMLYYNNRILCKFVKKTNSQYKVVWINQGDLYWDGTDQLSELYIIDSRGNKNDCTHLVTYLPKLNKPSLWTKYSDAQWILEKGSHTSQEEGFVLFPEEYTQNTDGNAANVNICGKSFKWIAFKNEIILSNESDQNQFRFKASSKKIEWCIIDEKPNWMPRANFPIVRRKPKVVVLDEAGNTIRNVVLKWRQKPINVWNNWNVPIPRGVIEFQIQAGNVVECDEFFNIEYLDIKIDSKCLHSAEIELVNNAFLFHINENQLVAIEKITADKIRLELKNNTNLPDAIQASLKSNNQSRGLRFEMLPPFKGVEIIDNNQKIVTNGVGLTLANLNGYRLMSNMTNLVVNIYNTQRQHIIISEKLTGKFMPSLRTFEDKINQLYALSDSVDGDAEIVFEICQEGSYAQTKIREYRIKRYNQRINWRFDQDNIHILETNSTDTDLYAVPLNCTNEELNLYDLEFKDGNYCFRCIPKAKKFVIFCNKESDAKIQPAFICLNSEEDFAAPEDPIQRIIELKDELLNATPNEDLWQRFLSYYKICLNNELSYSTFDILKAIAYSSRLAARCFVFLLCYDDTQTFIEDSNKKMEQDLGFSFHWVNKDHWSEAMDWIGRDKNPQLMQVVGSAVKSYFDNIYPSSHFSQIANYVIQNVMPRIQEGYFLNGRIFNLRASLGSRVLNELPQKCPKIPEPYKNIIPVSDANANVKILLKSPVAVAISIAGKDETLWGKESDHIRRNVKYTYQLNPEWYSEAINYCLTKL